MIPARATVLSSIAASYPKETLGLARYQKQEAECPACHTVVLVDGDYSVEWEEEADYGEEWYIADVIPVVTFYPGHLRCRACDLELNGDDEMNAADLTSWQIEDVDFDDFYDEWESSD
jgi:hypothetical protein